MKIAVLCNSEMLVIPSLRMLVERDMLLSVGIPEKNSRVLRHHLINAGIKESAIEVFSKDGFEQKLTAWINNLEPDGVWVFSFPWRIPSSVLEVPRKGFLNFHFGLLPKYPGTDPIFWQIKNREPKCGLTVHAMTPAIDQGPVVFVIEADSVPGESYGMNIVRMGWLAAQQLDTIILNWQRAQYLENMNVSGFAKYYKRPTVEDLTIDWDTQGSEEIESLVNACNPKYDGAVAYFRGQEMRILEASPIDVPSGTLAEAGTIIHADALYGVVVACCDQKYLRLLVFHIPEGYISGAKLTMLGIKPGEQFTNTLRAIAYV